MVSVFWFVLFVACAPELEGDTALDCWWCAEDADSGDTGATDTGETPSTSAVAPNHPR